MNIDFMMFEQPPTMLSHFDCWFNKFGLVSILVTSTPKFLLLFPIGALPHKSWKFPNTPQTFTFAPPLLFLNCYYKTTLNFFNLSILQTCRLQSFMHTPSSYGPTLCWFISPFLISLFFFSLTKWFQRSKSHSPLPSKTFLLQHCLALIQLHGVRSEVMKGAMVMPRDWREMA